MSRLTVNTQELFNLNMSWEATGIAENVYNRAICDAESLDEGFENLWGALDDELIYTADRWTVMQEYQTPEEANFDDAYMKFYDDLSRHYYEIVEGEEEEEEEEEE